MQVLIKKAQYERNLKMLDRWVFLGGKEGCSWVGLAQNCFKHRLSLKIGSD